MEPSRPARTAGDSAARGSVDFAYPSPAYRYRLTTGLAIWLALKAVAFALFAMGHWRAGLLAFFVWDPWLLWNILVPASRGFGPVVSRFRTKEREVWLTIDDGPDPLTTPRLLELLERHGAHATFFVIGQQAERHPELIREMLRRGHTIENHTASHACGSFWAAGAKRIGAEIDGCSAAIVHAGGQPPALFRAPVGIKTPFLHPQLATRGLTAVAWSARGFDSTLSTALAVKRIVAGIQPGAIILLHDGQNDIGRVAVVERVLEHLSRTGYRAVVPARESLR